MANIQSTIKSITLIERILLLVTFVALLVRYFFHFESMFFLEVFAVMLTLMYFPFGFYAIGRPGPDYSLTIPIILGFVYALGILSLLICAGNIDSYRYPILVDFSVLLLIVIYLIFRMRKLDYPAVFINTQYVRIGYIILCGLVIVLKSPIA